MDSITVKDSRKVNRIPLYTKKNLAVLYALYNLTALLGVLIAIEYWIVTLFLYTTCMVMTIVINRSLYEETINKLSITNIAIKGEYKGKLFYNKLEDLHNLNIDYGYNLLEYQLGKTKYQYILSREQLLKVEWFLQRVGGGNSEKMGS